MVWLYLVCHLFPIFTEVWDIHKNADSMPLPQHRPPRRHALLVRVREGRDHEPEPAQQDGAAGEGGQPAAVLGQGVRRLKAAGNVPRVRQVAVPGSLPGAARRRVQVI